MKKIPCSPTTRMLSWIIVFIFILTACGGPGLDTSSSGSLRAWMDQPPDGFTLPLAPFPLKAHARQAGGGVTAIDFMVNDVLLGSAATDSAGELVDGTVEWNPSSPGNYLIQAVARNAAGARGYSDVVHICIGSDAETDCAGPVSAGISPNIDTSIKIVASPLTVSAGAACRPEDRIVTFQAYVHDTTGAIEVDAYGDLVGATGERSGFAVALTPVAGEADAYTGTLDLGELYDGVLGGVDGTLEFQLGLLNESKEWFVVSEQDSIDVHFCGGEKLVEGVLKVGGFPSPVYIGKCTAGEPVAIDFEAGTDIDPASFARIDLAYVWFDRSGTWVGTVGTENRVAMTPIGGGGFTYRLEMSSAPGQMDFGGSVKFRAIMVNSSGMDIAYSEVSEIPVIQCGAAQVVTPSRTPTKYQAPVQPGITPSVTAKPVSPPKVITITPTKTSTPEPPPPPPPPPEEKPGYIEGRVYEDTNGDGKWNNDEPVWSYGGLSVYAEKYFAEVDNSGYFLISEVEPGGYDVTLNHPGYSTTTSDSFYITIYSGETVYIEYGVLPPG